MGKPEGSRPLGRLIVCDRIILKWINVKWGGGEKMDWIDPAQDRDRRMHETVVREELEVLDICV